MNLSLWAAKKRVRNAWHKTKLSVKKNKKNKVVQFRRTITRECSWFVFYQNEVNIFIELHASGNREDSTIFRYYSVSKCCVFFSRVQYLEYLTSWIVSPSIHPYISITVGEIKRYSFFPLTYIFNTGPVFNTYCVEDKACCHVS